MSGSKAQPDKKPLVVSQIIAVLPKLKASELAVIKAAIEQLLPKQVPGYEAQLLFDAILTRLELHLPWYQFSMTSAYKDFQTHAPGAVLFITKTFGGTQTRLMAVMKFCIGLLMDDLKQRQIPLTLGTVCRNLNTLPMVFDAAFPDYRVSGLIPMLMKQMEK